MEKKSHDYESDTQLLIKEIKESVRQNRRIEYSVISEPIKRLEYAISKHLNDYGVPFDSGQQKRLEK